MLTLISIIAILLSFTLRIIPLARVFFASSLLIFSVAIDGVELGFWEHMFIYDRVEVDFSIILYWLCYVIAFVTFCLVQHRRAKDSLVPSPLIENIDVPRFIFCARMIALASILCAFINVLRAGDISLMLVSPRDWERAFGSNVLINYVYFLHALSAVMLTILFYYKKANKLDFFLFFLCVFVSLLHGVKFTILHVFAYISLSLYILSGNKLHKYVYYLFFTFLTILFVFFTFVRGGGIEGILGYIMSASVNSLYIINTNDIIDIGSFNSIFPFFDPNLSNKIVTRLGGEFVSSGVSVDSGFSLNDKYNLTAAITKLAIPGPFGFVFFSALLGLIIRLITKANSFFRFIFLVHVLYCILMMFTAWEFYKFKLLFILFVSFFVSLFCSSETKSKVELNGNGCLSFDR